MNIQLHQLLFFLCISIYIYMYNVHWFSRSTTQVLDFLGTTAQGQGLGIKAIFQYGTSGTTLVFNCSYRDCSAYHWVYLGMFFSDLFTFHSKLDRHIVVGGWLVRLVFRARDIIIVGNRVLDGRSMRHNAKHLPPA